MIGTGIFIVPAAMARQLPSPELIILVWVVAGVFTLAGALTYSELGSSLPETGGEYVYLRDAYGPFTAFLYGWCFFLVIKTGSIAAIATGFAKYAIPFLERFGASGAFLSEPAVSPWLVKGIAVLVIALLTAINCLSIRCAAWIQNIFTFLKAGAVVGLIAGSLLSQKGDLSHLSQTGAAMAVPALLTAFGAAMIQALWAYDGWNNLSFTAGEMKEPQKNIPLALLLGTGAVMLLYVAVNVAYMYLVPLAEMQKSERIASDAIRIFMGTAGVLLISGAIVLSSFGSANGTILSGARSHYALARDGLFFPYLAKVHPTFQTPAGSLVAQGAWASILALSGTYDSLLNYVMFVTCIFYTMVGFSIFIFRKKYPDTPRPYRTPGYPFTPAFFVLATILLVVNTFVTHPLQSALGIAFLLSGIPAWFYFSKARGERTARTGDSP